MLCSILALGRKIIQPVYFLYFMVKHLLQESSPLLYSDSFPQNMVHVWHLHFHPPTHIAFIKEQSVKGKLQEPFKDSTPCCQVMYFQIWHTSSLIFLISPSLAVPIIWGLREERGKAQGQATVTQIPTVAPPPTYPFLKSKGGRPRPHPQI